MKKKSSLIFFPCAAVGFALIAGLASSAFAQQRQNQLKEPVYRISKKVEGNSQHKPHPMEEALALADRGLENIRQNIRDYTAVIAKRERIDGELGKYEYIFTKIRNEKKANGRIVVPFAVYMYFLEPVEFKGRECLYVRGHNDGKMLAHDSRNTFWGKFGSHWLDPQGAIAMKGQRYPITEAGLETLIIRLIEKGTADLKHGECDVKFYEGATVCGRKCTMFQLTHPVPRDHFDFYKARIFIDDELNVPIRYAAWTWPSGRFTPDQNPTDRELIEEYTYTQLKLNVGLTNTDFDPESDKYGF